MARETTSQNSRKTAQQSSRQNAATNGSTNARQGTSTNARQATSTNARQGTATTNRQQNASATANQHGGADRERAIDRSQERGARTQGSSGLARRPEYATGAVRNAGGSPYSLMQRMAEDMEQLFEQFGFGRGFGLGPAIGAFGGMQQGRGERMVWNPQVEIARRGDQLVVRADVPGVNKEDLQVDVDNDVLTIRGERRESHEENEGGFYRTERSYGQFYRAIPLPEGTSSDQVNAEYRDGVLEISLPAPRQIEGRGRRIQIR